ncbi:14035_t:CDS:1, partial [Acaulospora morrowiae]
GIPSKTQEETRITRQLTDKWMGPVKIICVKPQITIDCQSVTFEQFMEKHWNNENKKIKTIETEKEQQQELRTQKLNNQNIKKEEEILNQEMGINEIINNVSGWPIERLKILLELVEQKEE